MAWRLQRQCLHQRAPHDAVLEITGRLGGVQAQLMSSAELALWARIENLRSEDVQRALWKERTLVKTWAMRGTLHLLPASELQLWQQVPRLDRRYVRPSWLRYFGISADELERLTAAVAGVLDGRTLTREELVNEVSRVLGSEELGAKLRHSWGMMLKPAAFRCLLCFAPGEGRNVRFTAPASWLPDVPAWETECAEREVTRRFLAAYGPATREAYAQWLGVPASRAGALIRAMGEEVIEVEVEGVPGWIPANQRTALEEARSPGSVRLLPAFDQYVLTASRHAANLLPGPFRDRIYRPQGWLSPVLLVDGRMDGVWKHERTGKRLTVQIEPFVDLSDHARRGAEEEAERLASFMGAPLDLTWHAL